MTARTRVVLHIGLHKTGTSAIQRHLAANAPTLLEEHGVLYAMTGRDLRSVPFPDHHRLAWASVARYAHRPGAEPGEGLFRVLHREVRERKPRVVVLSSEFFWPADADEVARLRERLAKFHVTVVVFVRNPLALAVSSFKQRVKKGAWHRSFREYLDYSLFRYDYASILERWRADGIWEAFAVHIFDKARATLFETFAEAADLPIEVGLGAAKPENVSPPDSATRIMQGLNRFEHWFGCHGTTAGLRRQVVGKRGVGPFLTRLGGLLHRPLPHPSDIDHFRGAVASFHPAFLERHVPLEDRHFLEF